MAQFRRDFEPEHGRAVEIAPGLRRITAANEGPFTFRGTNTYIVGRRELAVIDPGPDDPQHLRAILAATSGAGISHILVTHTHMDHSPLAATLARMTGAEIVAEGPHRLTRSLHPGEDFGLDAAGDRNFFPDRRVYHGELIKTNEWSLEAILTPGHCANHCAFALHGADLVFSGDHVMAWSTTIVAPPDGSMGDYMRSLDLLAGRRENIYLPGHGGQLENARDFVRALKAHRKMREAAILARIRAGDRTIRQIVGTVYRDTNPALHGAAALSTFAHIEMLIEAGQIQSDGPPTLDSEYRPA